MAKRRQRGKGDREESLESKREREEESERREERRKESKNKRGRGVREERVRRGQTALFMVCCYLYCC